MSNAMESVVMWREVRARLRAVLVSLLVSGTAEAQLRVPATWSLRPALPPFGDVERDCMANLPEHWRVSIDRGRLRATAVSWDMPITSRPRDPLPYAMDLSGALVDLDGPGLAPLPPPPPPVPGKPSPPVNPEMHRARAIHDRHEWNVRDAREVAHRVVVKTDAGWLVGFDGGEFGGSLWWYPLTPGPGRLLHRGSTRWIETMGQGFVAIGGLSHGGRHGVAWLSKDDESGWLVRGTEALRGAPAAIVRTTDDQPVVAADHSLNASATTASSCW